VDAYWVKGPYLRHASTINLPSFSGTYFRPRYLTLVFRKSPVDDYVSNSQVDASREPMDDFQLARAIKALQKSAREPWESWSSVSS